MSRPVIRVEGLSKRYVLGANRAARAGKYDTFRDAITRRLKRTLQPAGSAAAEEGREFHALRDVNFTIEPGQVVGIIGRNGAGKSTLLKILSRIVEPTAGRISLRGRVASLLEVGTGFHPELSGRENIFLNGVILGMTRAEVARRFDEIVAFAEVDRFVDTPVKHYSSGMYVRLAFAVAAHLDPEILIVDEVLAVGDAAFQEKCLGKMRNACREEGRTVLFVSHNAGALLGICKEGIWLDRGQVAYEGTIQDCLGRYNGARAGSSVTFEDTPTSRPSIRSIALDEEALAKGDLVFRIGFRSPFPLKPPVVGVVLFNKLGQPLFGANSRMVEAWAPGPQNEGVIEVRRDGVPLCNDTYRISVWLGDASQDYDARLDALTFDYLAQPFVPQATEPMVSGSIWLPWRFQFESNPPA